MSLFDISASLTLDITKFQAAVKGAKSVASGIGKGLKTGMKVGVAAVATATTAVGAFAKGAISAGSDFDTAMSQVAATSGKTMPELEKEVGSVDTAWGTFDGNLREYAQFMGSNTAFSATQAAEALNYMALAGYDAQTSMNMLPNVLNLAAAGNMDLANASDMVTDAQTALGLNLDQTSDMVDQMALTSSKTNTSVSQLGEAFLTIGANARNIKGGTTELSTVLGVLADNGIKGAEAGTHLRNMMLALQSPTDDAAALLDDLGVAVYDSDGNMRSMIDIVGDMQTSLGDMDNASRDAIVSGIFNKTDLAAVNALLGTSRGRFDELTKQIGSAEGAAQKMADVQLDNLSGDVTLFKSALEGAQIAVSDQLTPTLRKFTQFGTSALSTLTEAFKEGGLTGAMEALGTILSEGLSMVIQQLPIMVDAGVQLLGSLIQGVVDNLPTIIDAAVQILTTLMTAFADNVPLLLQGSLTILLGLVQGITENLPMLLPAIIAIITAIPTFLAENAETIVQAGVDLFLALVQNLPEIIAGITAAIGSIIKAIIKALGALLKRMPEIFKEIWKAIKKIFANPAKFFKEKFKAAVDKVKEIWSNIKAWFKEKWQGIKEVFSNVPKFFKEKFKAAIDKVKEIWKAIKTWFKERWQGIKEVFANPAKFFKEKFKAAIDKVKEIWKGIKAWFKERWQGIKDTFANVPKFFKEKFKGAIEKVKEIWKAIKTWFKERWQGIKEVFASVPKFFKEKFKAAIEKVKEIWSGIKAWFKERWQGIKDTFASVPTWFKDKFKSAWQKIKDIWSGVKGWFQERWQGIKDTFTSVPTWFRDKFKSAWQKIKDVFSPIKQWFKDVWKSIKDTFANIPKWFKDKFNDAWTKVKNVFSTGGEIFQGIVTGISDVFKSVVNSIIRGINNVVAVPFNAINTVLRKLKGISIVGVKPFGWVKEFAVPEIPLLAKGGVLKRGEVGLLEGNGAEAVVPLDKNKEWVRAVAEDMRKELDQSSSQNIINMNIYGAQGQDVNELADIVIDRISTQLVRRKAAFA